MHVNYFSCCSFVPATKDAPLSCLAGAAVAPAVPVVDHAISVLQKVATNWQPQCAAPIDMHTVHTVRIRNPHTNESVGVCLAVCVLVCVCGKCCRPSLSKYFQIGHVLS